MEKYKIVRIRAISYNRLVKKTEAYINKIFAKGIYEVVSISFSPNNAIVTWGLIER